MEYTELPFELERQNTCASLSAQDLRDMGKQASNKYLCGECSLNDAIVKVAREHAGISTHQVRRVLEFANTNTFQSLFEKQAGDKNIEFPIAEPEVVLRKLSSEVEAPIVRPADSDYAKDPVKIGERAKNIEADIELCKVFGMVPKTAAIEKTAEFGSFIRNMAIGAGIGAATSALQSGVGSMTSPDEQQDVFSDAISGAMGGAMNAFGPAGGAFGGVAAPAIGDILSPMIPPIGGGDETEPFDTRLASSPLDKLLSKFAKAGGNCSTKTVEAVQHRENSNTKIASDVLFKQAMSYAKSGRDIDGLVQTDLEQAVSIDSIKQATAQDPYPNHDPFGDLFRMKQTLEKLSADAYMAKIHNKEMTKMAIDNLHKVVSDSVLQGTNFGEIVHGMNHVADGQWVKEAVAQIAPMLAARGFNLVKLSASMIPYEMQKIASRAPNPNNPILSTFASYVKVASNQPRLDAVCDKVAEALDQVESRVRKVLEASHVNRGK